MFISDKEKINLKNLFLKKEYSKFEKKIESFGNLGSLPDYLLMGYAGSKISNPDSKKNDYIKSSIIFEKIYKKNRDNKEALYNLIISSIKAETSVYVLDHLKEEYRLDNKNIKIIEGLARIHFMLGNMDLSVEFFEKLKNLLPKNIKDGGKSTYLSFMNYVKGFDQNFYKNQCIEFAKNFNDVEKNYKLDFKFKKQKIKIGFLSGDFKSHSISFFLIDLIKKIDKSKFELVAFSNLNLKEHDEVTNFYKLNFNEWYDINSLSDKIAVNLIRSKNIDFLFDLSGFTRGNRINVIANRCAKNQISWLGYNNTIGLKNVDYLLSDHYLINENEKNLYTEKILFMPSIWNAMCVPEHLPEIIEKNIDKDNTFIFGSFNNFKKISNEVIKTWSKILNTIAGSKLYLKNSSGYNQDLYNNLFSKFTKEKVDNEKIIFLNRSSDKKFLKDYNKIDLALDTFPYPGVTTSFQAYLMGVPVLTMKGFNMNSRCGFSINKNLKMDSLIAENIEDYIQKAIFFKKNYNSFLSKPSLRKKSLDSNLFNTDKFVEEFSKILIKIL
jgi:predicted O-linked N-acetylglucosamine transferase (SPINDLY family)